MNKSRNFKLYVVALIFSVIGTGFGAFTTSYLDEKGRFLAIETSLDTILKEVKATTEVSEGIRFKLDHDNWRSKELELLKRKN